LRGILEFFGGGQHFQPPQLMPRINRGRCFLLTKAVTKNHLAKLIYGGGHYKITASKNNLFTEAVIQTQPPP
jgi:hypothetical protein